MSFLGFNLCVDGCYIYYYIYYLAFFFTNYLCHSGIDDTRPDLFCKGLETESVVLHIIT